MIEVTLDGMPPIKKPRKRVVKKHHTTKNVPVEISVRRQVAEEIGDAEPTKDQKFILLQKYGATAPRIDRLNVKPSWMSIQEFKRKQNDWFQATRGLVRPEQRKQWQNKVRNTFPNTTANTKGRFNAGQRRGIKQTAREHYGLPEKGRIESTTVSPSRKFAK